MRRSDLLKSLPVSRDDFVVEIGSGPAPFPGTKLIVEKFPFENLERWGNIKRIAPMVQADALSIPLKDQSCDLLFVSHVLEHLDQPESFLKEAQRCAKKIYLEFPTFYRELMYAWSFHKWVVEIQGLKLICYRNDVPQMFHDFFHKNYDLLLHIWSEERFQELNSYLYTDTASLSIEISTQSALEVALQRGNTGDSKVNFAETEKHSYSTFELLGLLIYNALPKAVLRWKRNLFEGMKEKKFLEIDSALFEKFQCPRCRSGELKRTENAIQCVSCGTEFPKVKGIYHFAR
jgi:SAM-dependent methyltransferase